jgi:hypothetical protein
VWVLGIGLLDFSLEQAIVVPALPAMAQAYDASPTSVTWVLTAFLLAAAVATPIAGRLGDRHGKRLVLTASLGLLVAGSVLCAVGDSIAVVIAGRVVQGLGAGVGPLAVALARDNLPREQVARAVGILVGLGGAGGVVGFLACGLLIEYVSVQAIFWFVALFGVACLAAVLATVSESGQRTSATVDWLGALLLGAALVALLLAISEGNAWHWGSTRIVALLGSAVVLLAVFWRRERTTAAPLLDPRALATPPLVAANVGVFVVGYALLVVYVLVPLIAGSPESTGYGLGLSTIELALLLAPSAAGALAGGLLSARAIAAFGSRAVVSAAATLGIATYVGFIAVSPTATSLAVLMIPPGFATGLAIAALNDIAVLSAPADQTGVIVGGTSVIRAVGSALGAQVAIAIFIAGPKLASGLPAYSGITDAFVMSLIATVAALGAVLLTFGHSSDPVRDAQRAAGPA